MNSSITSIFKRNDRINEYVWAPFAVGLLIAVTGFLGFIFRAPWLFPSLGPTAYLIAKNPHYEETRFYNIVMGHFLAIVVSFGVVC